jgi:hypothetical protein
MHSVYGTLIVVQSTNELMIFRIVAAVDYLGMSTDEGR